MGADIPAYVSQQPSERSIYIRHVLLSWSVLLVILFLVWYCMQHGHDVTAFLLLVVSSVALWVAKQLTLGDVAHKMTCPFCRATVKSMATVCQRC